MASLSGYGYSALTGPRHPWGCVVVCAIVMTSLGMSPVANAQSSSCPDVRPVVQGTSSDVLGTVAELKLHSCPGAPWSFIIGVRYMSQPGSVDPYVALVYSRPLAPRLSLQLDATLNERSGDTLLNRLPEVSLRWSPFAHRTFLVPSLELSLGSISLYNPQVQAVRAAGVLNLTTQQIRLGPMVELTPSLRFGRLAYATGQTHTFWVGTVGLVVRPTSKTEVGVSYTRQEGSGASPLGYDAVGSDRTLSGRVGVVLSPSATVSVTANVSLQTQPSTITEYVFSWTRSGKWTVGFTWRQSDGRVLLGAGLSP